MTARVGQRIEITGTVQGVGFRPFVWRLATGLDLTGHVRNRGGSVEIEAFGPADALARLIEAIRTAHPPQASVQTLATSALPPRAGTGFELLDSMPDTAGARLFPSDLATCDACLAELFDPGDRRFRYPFINCTDCGPRASIIDRLPYDRGQTTMDDFPMCARCRAEYADPADRRFHAEPIACPDCGPRLTWWAAGSRGTGDDALVEAADAVAAGAIIAAKGIGGYHLLCDATNEAAVQRLRTRKRRMAKPFAVMVADVEAARAQAELGPAHERLLVDPARPIVLAPGRRAGGLAPAAVLGHRDVGILLPYTAVHHLMLRAVGRPLVCTSGNLADEPIAIDDQDAVARLSTVAEGFLAHDRRIRCRYEDSVAQVVAGRPSVLRRGRGYAPCPLPLPVPAPEPGLASGPQLKHTYAIALDDKAFVSSHLGDLEDPATFDAFEVSLGHQRRLLEVDPAWVAHDIHPGYLSTRYAQRYARRIPVQHHHAHIASCLAEHGGTATVVGIALDGLGMGDDGTFWGGEVLVADLTSYRRVGRFGRAPLPGGAAAVRQPWRTALGYLFGGEFAEPPDAWVRRFVERFDPVRVAVVRRQVERGVNSPIASSAGRLFDAAASILGLGDVNEYEAQAALALEQAADPRERGRLPVRFVDVDGLAVFDPAPALAALVRGRLRGGDVAVLASRFQRTVADAVVHLAAGAATAANVDTVCLSGGVFAHRWLTEEVERTLTAAGYRVIRNERVPCGDGGISYGQAAVAAARLARAEEGG